MKDQESDQTMDPVDGDGDGDAHYDAQNDPEAVQVDVVSPAKNRHNNTPVMNSKENEQRNGKRNSILFERAASTWWNLRFDSQVLEEQHRKSSFPYKRRRFQYALLYILVSCAVWTVYFACTAGQNWIGFTVGALILLGFNGLALLLTYTSLYRRFYTLVSVVVSIVLCALLLGCLKVRDPDLSSVWSFTISVEIIIMMYTVIPLPLFGAVILGVIYSVLYEVLNTSFAAETPEAVIIFGKALMHLAIHAIGIYIYVMSEVRLRSTFWKVCQSIMARREMQLEKSIKEKMIHSLMPPSVAAEVMKSREESEGDVVEREKKKIKKRKQKKGSKGIMAFRPFNMHCMDNVSILFADIVGFTKMSSNKTAEHLVSLLNDLFGRFDKICAKTGCEKITTLGDCYYCVSNCPDQREDHARCCVEMGLDMIKAIQQFDIDHNEEVSMRVGVHTGRVLCGIVGTRRFKFDVFSNDVEFANYMESSGQPGRVHLSEYTYKFLGDEYEVEEGESCKDTRVVKVLTEYYDEEEKGYKIRHVQDEKSIKTYFIVKRNRPEGEESLHGSRENCAKDPGSPDNRRGSLRTQAIITNHKESQDDDHEGGGEGGAEPLKDVEAGSPAKDDQVNGDVMPSMMQQMKEMDKHNDLQLIRYMNEDTTTQEYFYKPPINQCTLNFLKSDLEEDYRDHYVDDEKNEKKFSAPHFSSMLDMIVSLIVFLLMGVACFIGFQVRALFVILFIIFLIVLLLYLVPCVLHVVKPDVVTFRSKFAHFISSWYPRHAIGIIITCIPAIVVFSNFSCGMFTSWTITDTYFCYLTIVSLLHFCNFTNYSSWMKSVLGTIVGVVLVILLDIGACRSGNDVTTGEASTPGYDISTVVPDKDQLFSGEHALRFEAILDVVLILVLIWFLNREIEISNRIGYHGDLEASNDRIRMEEEKDQADWLLHNIIPEHVSDVLKETSKYSRNHKDVGVIFAAITNFDEMYDESFEGGMEFLRVLNELVGDFEVLLSRPEYKDVEKIKTIAATFMGASGLNPAIRSSNKDASAHLYALMDFSLDMLNVIQEFNEGIFNFDFILKIGFNYGEVTAGVIGTTKLLFDIWGDTVNVASRMYSTGKAGRIQVTADTAQKLGEHFEFEYRGVVFAKGKGDIDTYLCVGKKPGASWS